MSEKPTYEELEKQVLKLEHEAVKCKLVEEALLLQQKRITEISAIGALANSTLDLEAVLNNILKATLKTVNASAGMIFLKEPVTECLFWGASSGLSKAFVDEFHSRRIKPGEGLTGCISQSGESVYIPVDSSHDPRIARPVIEAEGLNSFIGVPIYADDKIVGVMNILTHPPVILSEHDVYLCSAIGSHVGLAIRNAQLFTKHKQAKETLRKSESFKNIIVESSPDCIKLLDLEGNLKYMSKGGQEKLKIKDIKVYLNKSWIDFWQGEDNINARVAVDTAIKGAIGKFRGYSPTETGIPRWWDVIITPIWGDNGKVEQLLAASRDVTEQKQMEESLQQALKMESIGTLTGGVAHDFNNILGIIIGNTELALDDVPAWNPAHSNLEEIKTASLRASKIVKQLLSFSRKTDQKLQPIEIAFIIKDALKFLRSTIPTTIDIQQDIQGTDETILADPTQINQVMMNLCINASQAMEQTGGNLTVNMEKVILDDNLAKDYPDLKSGKHVKVTVSDTGPGIDPGIIDRIFDPYFTTKEVGKGSGMGLSVVHGIVTNHNGSISVDSKPGKGTTFSILFPVATEKPEIEKDTTEELLLGSETVLFVDDEESIEKVVSRMLGRLGYQVKTALTPQDALAQFSADPKHFDLVITDMTMPEMTGVILSEKIMGIRPDIPVIICTGHSALIDEERAKQLGIAAYIMKPIIMTEIAKTIRKVLDEAKGSAQG